MQLRTLAILLPLAAVGCTSAAWLAPTKLAASRDPAAIQTAAKAKPEPDRLILHADFPLSPDHRMIQELISERELIGERLGIPPGTEPIHVYLFAEEQAYRDRVSQDFPDFPHRRAIFVETDVQLSVYAHWGNHVAEDLRHEVAHGYLHASVPNLPIWLDEGLAEYFEVGRGRRGLNRVHVELLRGQMATASWKPNLTRLETLPSAAEMTQLDYAEAWLWVHWMLEGAGEGHDVLQTFLVDLREDRPAAPISQRLARATPNPEAQLVAHLESLQLEP